MKGSGSKVLKIFLAVMLFSFLFYQIYSLVYKPITTATAVSTETYSGIDIEGYFVRQEQIIDYKATGNERYIVDEGEKVSKDGVIAEIYSSPSVAATHVRIDELNNQIKTLQTMNSASDPSSVDLDNLNSKIKDVYLDFLNHNDNGKFLNVDEFSNQLLVQMNRKQILTGEASNFDGLISSLKNEVATLSSGLPAATKTIKSNSSGFFVSNVDGLEDVLKISEIENFDVSIIDKINGTKETSGFGKIVTSYDWYIICKMTGDDYLKFNIGDSVTIKSPIEGSEVLSANVYKINVSPEKNEALVVFSCNMMNGKIATTRHAKMTVVTENYSGIRISNKALRVLNGQTGVYIIQGSIVKFKPVEIIYSADTYSICKIDDTGSSSSLRLFDEVIEKGKNLYDGKYIN